MDATVHLLINSVLKRSEAALFSNLQGDKGLFFLLFSHSTRFPSFSEQTGRIGPGEQNW